MLDLGEHGEVIGVDEYVPAFLERCQRIRPLLEVENDVMGRSSSWRFHTRRTVGSGSAETAPLVPQGAPRTGGLGQ
jgi:hypothetical protein